MKGYRNLDGDSGILAYDYGDEWIHIQFKHGRTYEYLASTIGLSHLSAMQRLADSGRGLVTYINTNSHVKDGYSRMW
jgi:hypothetical protein